MKKLLLFAAIAGLGLVSAKMPADGPDPGARDAPRHYPPCSRTVTDRCNQLHERGGRHHAGHRGHREHSAHAEHRDHRDHSAHAGHGRHRAHAQHAAAARPAGGHAVRAPAAAHRRLANRVRRAGERG